ncbi:MAG: 4-(cytidine 5'-diphospho)-2-C-methyl-D-erythritol kinase [Planctomycetaceae bacterium]
MRAWLHGPTLFVHSPAKLNLFLEILARRDDGFHELETLMLSLALHDTLAIQSTADERSSLRVVDGGGGIDTIPAGRDNLVLRAVDLLQRHTGIPQQTHITLWKRVPPQSGMAGGSSNAAATLFGLNRVWDIGLSNGELLQLGAQLGSDVNFFLSGHAAAICRGRGEIIEPVAFPYAYSFVIVKPGSGLSTPDVFRNWTPSAKRRTAGPLLSALQRGRLPAVGNHLHNALQQPAQRLNRDVAALIAVFNTLPVTGHLMTGSGTACYGLCAHQTVARRLAARLRALRVGRVMTTRIAV